MFNVILVLCGVCYYANTERYCPDCLSLNWNVQPLEVEENYNIIIDFLSGSWIQNFVEIYTNTILKLCKCKACNHIKNTSHYKLLYNLFRNLKYVQKLILN